MVLTIEAPRRRGIGLVVDDLRNDLLSDAETPPVT